MELKLLVYEDEVIDYELPNSWVYEVVDSEIAIAGDTATGATKKVTTQTGLSVVVPLFVEVGDKIKVNTETGAYITRA